MTASLSQLERGILAVIFDTVIPKDDSAAGWDGGVAAVLGEPFMAWSLPALREVVALAADVHVLSEEQRLALVAGLPEQLRSTVLRVAFEGYYGGTSEPAGWQVAGFLPLLGITPVEPSAPRSIRQHELRDHYDVVIIGAGAGGGAAASVLAATGQTVLLLERSRQHSSSELRGNHLQGKRLERYDVTAGPGAGNPRTLDTGYGIRTLDGDGSGADYGLVALTLGGGTRVWQGMSWRFLPEDFAMASTYGVPAGSTLADWPFDYAELAPYYERAEWELGVSGADTGALADRYARPRGYPMPALSMDVSGERYLKAAATLGWSAAPIPFAINSRPANGRAACVRCQQCVGHACPVDAKNGAQNTFIPRALEHDTCDLLQSARVISIVHNDRGRASGVVVSVGEAVIEVAADVIVVAAGAVETPRLLLASQLGNDWVGRNHHSHGVAIALAMDSPWSKDRSGPGHSVATIDFAHANGAAWGGGVMFDTPVQYPLAAAERGMMSAPSPFGMPHKNWMRTQREPLGVMSMVQEIPHESARVTLDPVVTDSLGMPAARFAGVAHEASVEAAHYMAARCTEWVEALGGSHVFPITVPGVPQGSEHSAGTVRLADDPRFGACDPSGLLYGTENVYISDASLHPTNGGFNPGLTVIANAIRVAEHISRN